MTRIEVRTAQEIEQAFSTIKRNGSDAVIVPVASFFGSQRQRIADLALKNRVAALFPYRESVESGGLLSYGYSISESYRYAATYVDKILKGAKPGDLPVEQPTRLDLTINRRTAKALGLTIPQELLLRADRVIE